MTDQQIQDIADRVIEALQESVPGGPHWWEPVAAFGPYAALLAAVVAFLIGRKSIRHQTDALSAQIKADSDSLKQKSESDARSEWWKRTQWALDAAASENPMTAEYGSGMLDLLARSKMVEDEDTGLLDVVWERSSTEMDDEGINQLIEEARAQQNVSEDQQAWLDDELGVDAGSIAGDTGSSKEDNDG